jgi:hypothetical protein
VKLIFFGRHSPETRKNILPKKNSAKAICRLKDFVFIKNLDWSNNFGAI